MSITLAGVLKILPFQIVKQALWTFLCSLQLMTFPGDVEVGAGHYEASKLWWQRARELNSGLCAAWSTSLQLFKWFGSAACCTSHGAEKQINGMAGEAGKQCLLLSTTGSHTSTAFLNQYASS